MSSTDYALLAFALDGAGVAALLTGIHLADPRKRHDGAAVALLSLGLLFIVAGLAAALVGSFTA